MYNSHVQIYDLHTAKTPNHLPIFLEVHYKIPSILEIEDVCSTEAPVWGLRRSLNGLDTKLWTLKAWHRKFVTHRTPRATQKGGRLSLRCHNRHTVKLGTLLLLVLSST